jgi:hypothetical protein
MARLNPYEWQSFRSLVLDFIRDEVPGATSYATDGRTVSLTIKGKRHVHELSAMALEGGEFQAEFERFRNWMDGIANPAPTNCRVAGRWRLFPAGKALARSAYAR